MTLSSGTKLSRYEIRSKLGEGGMGQVYLARDTSELDRTVAIKLLPDEVAADPKRMQRFFPPLLFNSIRLTYQQSLWLRLVDPCALHLPAWL